METPGSLFYLITTVFICHFPPRMWEVSSWQC